MTETSVVVRIIGVGFTAADDKAADNETKSRDAICHVRAPGAEERVPAG